MKINPIKDKSNFTPNIKTKKNSTKKNERSKKSYTYKKLSPSPFIKNKNNKTLDNNKIINININNILKIKKQYSLNITKSSDGSSKHIKCNNDKNIRNIKTKNKNIPLSIENKRRNKAKSIIKKYSRNHCKNINHDIDNPKNNLDLKNNKNYSSMLKKHFLLEQLYKKNI